MTTVLLATETAPVIREFVARTEANLTVEVRPHVTGYVKSFHFSEGKIVRQGQLLFEIDPAEFDVALRSAKARLARAQADVVQAKARRGKTRQDIARYEPLVKKRAIPREDYDNSVAAEQVADAEVGQAEAQVKVAESEVQSATINLGYTSIRSPLTGIIGRRQADPGNLVGPDRSAPLAVVSSSDPIRVSFQVTDAEYLRYLKPGTKRDRSQDSADYELILASGDTWSHKGRFYMVGRALNEETGTLRVVVLFPNPGNVLRPGQFGRVRTVLAKRTGTLLVPRMAVNEMQGTESVYLVRDDKVERRDIKTGGTWQDRYIVLKGLQPGDEVILEGRQKVRPGDQVRVRRLSAENLHERKDE